MWNKTLMVSELILNYIHIKNNSLMPVGEVLNLLMHFYAVSQFNFIKKV